MPKTWKPTTAGILDTVSAVFAFGEALFMTAFGIFIFGNAAFVPGVGFMSAMIPTGALAVFIGVLLLIACGVLAWVGGRHSRHRRKWRWALVKDIEHNNMTVCYPSL